MAAKAQVGQSGGTLEAKQAYIETLASYLQANPADTDAVALYRSEELSYARALVARGRYAAAVPHFEHVISQTIDETVLAGLQEELREVTDRITVTRAQIERLTRGMSPVDVRETIGEPRPGWTHTLEKAGVVHETWYYKRDDGGVASVLFRDDKVVLIEHGTILD